MSGISKPGSCYITTDRSGVIASVSASACRLLGLRPATGPNQLLGQGVLTLARWFPSDVLSDVLNAIQSGSSLDLQDVPMSLVTKTGPATMRLNISVVPLEEGGLIFLQDMTRYLVALDQWKREKDFSRMALDKGGALVVVLDREARIVKFNRACEKLTGYSEEEVLGRPVWDTFLTKEELGAVQNVFRSLVAGNAPSQFENYWVTRDGQLRRISWTNTVEVDHRGRVRHVIATGFDITDRHKREQEYREKAFLDPLTGLPNRAFVMEQVRLSIARCRRDHNQVFGVLFIDLDRFKDVNDRYGHLAGDRVLVEVATRFRHSLRETDTIGRLGGDEFLGVLDRVGGHQHLASVARRLKLVLEDDITVEGSDRVRVSASIGGTVADHRSPEPEQLLALADQAMYMAKQRNQGVCVLLPGA